MIARNFAVGLMISITLVLLPFQDKSFAQSRSQFIIENWLEAAEEYKFIQVSHDGIATDSNNITTINNLTINILLDKSVFGGKANKALDNPAARALGKSDTTKDEYPAIDITYTITFPELSFDSLTFDGNYYSARSIAAEFVLLDFKSGTDEPVNFSVSGSYDNVRVDDVRWSKLPELSQDADKPISRYFPLVAALLDISFEKASIDTMTMVQNIANGVFVTTTKYGRMEIAKTVRGNISRMQMANMNVEMLSRSGDKNTSNATPIVAMSSGNFVASNYNYRNFLDSFTPGNVAAGDDGPFKSFLGEMSLDAVRVKTGTSEFLLDGMNVTNFGVRAPNIDLFGEMDRLYLLSKTDVGLSGDNGPDARKIAELVGGIYSALRLGAIELRGMSFNVPEGGNGKMALYRIANLSTAGLGEFIVEGVNFMGNRGEFINLDRFSLADIKFPSLKSLINLEKAGKSGDIAAILEAIPTLSNIAAKGLEILIPGETEFSLSEYEIDMSQHIGPIPTKVEITVKDAIVPVIQLEKAPREVFGAMGFTELEFSYDLSAEWNETTNVLSSQTRVDLKDGGELDVDIDVGGIVREVFEKPQTIQSALAFATINRVQVNFVDDTLIDKGLAFVGATRGVSADTMKAQAIGMLPIILQVLERPAFVDKITQAVKIFLDSKGKITATATPAAPVLILQLMGAGATVPGAVIDMLNIEVNAQ